MGSQWVQTPTHGDPIDGASEPGVGGPCRGGGGGGARCYSQRNTFSSGARSCLKVACIAGEW
eukprot:COSAG01_NODE_1641_length_9647_cov_5.299539_6_plen_62_part_00